MKRKNEEEATQETTNEKKRQKLADRIMFVVTTTEYGVTEEEEEEENGRPESKRFFLCFLEKNDDEEYARKEEKAILSNANRMNPLYWFSKKKWEETEDSFEDLGFIGMMEAEISVVDMTFPNRDEPVVFTNDYLPREDDALIVYSEHTKKIKRETVEDNRLFKVKLSKDVSDVDDLSREIENTIKKDMGDDATVSTMYLEVKDTSTAMDWYNYLKDVRLVGDHLMEKVWSSLKEKGFCFDYPIQKDIE